MGEEHAVAGDVGGSVLGVDQRGAQRHAELDQGGCVVREQLGADLVEVFPAEAQAGDLLVHQTLHGGVDDAVGQPGVEGAQVGHEGDIGGQRQGVAAVGQQIGRQQRGVEGDSLPVLGFLENRSGCYSGQEVFHPSPQQLYRRVVERVLLGTVRDTAGQITLQFLEVIVNVFLPEV